MVFHDPEQASDTFLITIMQTAIRNTILIQTEDLKLRREIFLKYLDMDATIKAGPALEQSIMKQKSIYREKVIRRDLSAVSETKERGQNK